MTLISPNKFLQSTICVWGSVLLPNSKELEILANILQLELSVVIILTWCTPHGHLQHISLFNGIIIKRRSALRNALDSITLTERELYYRFNNTDCITTHSTYICHPRLTIGNPEVYGERSTSFREIFK